MHTSHNARILATMACSVALFTAMDTAHARTVSAWDLASVAANGEANMPVGEIATNPSPQASGIVLRQTAPVQPVLVASDPYSMVLANDNYVAQSVADTSYSSCQTNPLVPCVSLNIYPQAWSCSCTVPKPPGTVPEPGNLALLGIGLLGLLLSQKRIRGLANAA